MAATEFVPDSGQDRGGRGARHLDDDRPSLRRRLGRDDLGRQPQPRGHRHPGDPRDAEGDRPQPGARLRERRRLHPGVVATPRRASSTRSCSCVEGSIPNEELTGEGHWAAIGDDPETGQPITTNEWVDRLAPKAAAVVAIGTCATYGGIPAMKNNPTGRDGPRRLPRLGLEVLRRPARGQHPRLPGAARQHDRGPALPGAAPRRPGAGPRARRGAAAEVAVRAHGARGLQPRRLRRAGRVRDRVRRRPPLPGQARLQGPGRQVQRARSAAGSTATAAAPTSAASAWPARCPASPTSTCRSWSRTRRQPGREPRAVHDRADRALVPQAQHPKKYDVEPEWRKPGNQILTGYKSRSAGYQPPGS